jgi:hypothetical protein
MSRDGVDPGDGQDTCLHATGQSLAEIVRAF